MCGLALYLIVRQTTSATSKSLFSESSLAILRVACGVSLRCFAASLAVAPPPPKEPWGSLDDRWRHDPSGHGSAS